MRVALLPVFCLLWLSACTSPQEQLAEVEAGMLDLLGPTAQLKIPAGNRQTYLPLPPPLAVQDEQKNRAQQLLAKAAQIDTAALDPAHRYQLREYRKILTDWSASQSGWPLNPLDYTLAKPLQFCLAEPNGECLALLLEKMPDYYAEVEERWQSTHRHNYASAVQQCLTTLDTLQGLEQSLDKYPPDLQTRLRAALPPAQAVLKNYLGQCRSLVLE